jgi:hypothetical protein
MRTTRRMVGGLLVLAVALTGCGAADETARSTATDTAGEAADMDTVDAAAGDGAAGGSQDEGAPADDVAGGEAGTAEDGAPSTDAGIISVTSPLGRKVVFKAGLTLEVDDTAAAVEDIRRTTEAADGFVAAVDLHRTGEDDVLAGSMTVRVPTGELSTALSAFKELATRVVDERIDSDDVTEEYADIEAQLRNLRAVETELVALLADIRERSDDASQVLAVFQRIREIRGEIERLQGRQQVLDDLVALATVQVELRPAPSAAPITGDAWRPGEVAHDAIRMTVGALQTVTEMAIRLAITVVPILLIVLGLPMALALGVRRAYRRRSTEAG